MEPALVSTTAERLLSFVSESLPEVPSRQPTFEFVECLHNVPRSPIPLRLPRSQTVSPLHPQSELQLSWVADGGGDPARLSTFHRGVWLSELRVIEDVKRLRSKLYDEPLLDRKILEQGHVHVGAARSKQRVAAGVAESILARRGIRGGIKPALQ